METLYFAGGCFWCITPTFREMDGVYDVVSGYSGGNEENPTYEDVKYQRTGHRETIRVDFDPQQVSFETLLDIFLSSVDPFDGGGQYLDLDGEGRKQYEIEIFGIEKEGRDRNFSVRITDEALLAKTGGIVQGMSGSPIIQDGKLVGAVTHVLVNDPTRGYGIFIENMLEAAA